MRNYVILLVFLFAVATTVNAQDKTTITAIVASKGVGPIPSFSLDEPAVLVFSSMRVWKNLYYMPDVAFGLDGGGKGWFMDNWVKWVQPIDSLGRWSVSAGADWSLFFQPYSGTNGSVISQVVRYPTFELAGKFAPDTTQAVSAAYWYTYAVEKDYGVAGHYVSIKYSKTWQLGKRFLFAGDVNPFWISFSDGARGVSVSGVATLADRLTGLFIATQAIVPTVATAGKLSGNVSMGITRSF